MQVNEPDDLIDGAPDIAIDSYGIPWAIWASGTPLGANYVDVLVSSWNDQSWSPEINIHPPDTFFQGRPSIAFDDQGSGICVWQEGPVYHAGNPYFFNICYAYWNGIGWEPGGSVNEGDSLLDAGPIIDCGGDVYWVIWQGERTPESDFDDVFASRWNGSSWDTEMIVNPLDEHFDHAWPRVAVDTLGNPHVVWSTGNGCPPDIYYSTYNGDSWSLPYQVNEPDGDDQDLDPSIAIDDSGDIHVAWVGRPSDGDYRVYYSYFNGNEWSAEIQIDSLDGLGDYMARIAAKDPNDIWVCWDGVDSTQEYHIYVVHYDGQEWSQETHIDSDTTNFDANTEIALEQVGCPWVIWDGSYDYPHAGFEVFCNYYLRDVNLAIKGQGGEKKKTLGLCR
jgi:hypothetical protein